jgi:hypothetical protein
MQMFILLYRTWRQICREMEQEISKGEPEIVFGYFFAKVLFPLTVTVFLFASCHILWILLKVWGGE